MIDLGLIAAAKKAVATKPRSFVTPSVLLAFVMQESHGVPYFEDTKPGSLYSINVHDAMFPARCDEHGTIIERLNTGLLEKEIRQAIIIAPDINGYRPSRAMIGQPAKFRFELSQWNRFGSLPKMQRFRMACSWGLVQFLGVNIVGKLTDDTADEFIQRFAADTAMQLLYASGMIDELLVRTHGDVDRAYKGYNSGDIDSHNAKVMARSKAVAINAIAIETQLKKGQQT